MSISARNIPTPTARSIDTAALCCGTPKGAAPSRKLSALFLCSLNPAAARTANGFYYASPNTDMLGMIIERATGVPLCRLSGRPAREAHGRYRSGVCHRRPRRNRACRERRLRYDRRFGAARAVGALRGCGTGGAACDPGGLDRRHAPKRQPRCVECWEFRPYVPRRALPIPLVRGRRRTRLFRRRWHSRAMALGRPGQIVLVKFSSRREPSDDTATALEIHMLGQIAKAL
jgi:hypothetical protein